MVGHKKTTQAKKDLERVAGIDESRHAQRRREIVRAAYLAIAEKGFEGLRMREIARRAGLDHATLHYYFGGKEELIDGVFDYIVNDLAIGRAPVEETEKLGPRELLHAHFREIVRQVRERPEMFVVLTEINSRATRDARVRAIVAKNDRAWKEFLMAILREGIKKKEFQAGMGVEVLAEAIISLIRGTNVTGAAQTEKLERALQQLSFWLEGNRP
jgi:AcrR family transcriptional regulator